MGSEETARPPEKDSSQPSAAAEELGRKAAKLFKAARPRIDRLVRQAGPRVENASREAFDYAREHEDELRGTATRLMRARFAGPLGLVVDSFVRNRADSEKTGGCANCGSKNPEGSRFCNQCGAALRPDERKAPPAS